MRALPITLKHKPIVYVVRWRHAVEASSGEGRSKDFQRASDLAQRMESLGYIATLDWEKC